MNELYKVNPKDIEEKCDLVTFQGSSDFEVKYCPYCGAENPERGNEKDHPSGIKTVEYLCHVCKKYWDIVSQEGDREKHIVPLAMMKKVNLEEIKK